LEKLKPKGVVPADDSAADFIPEVLQIVHGSNSLASYRALDGPSHLSDPYRRVTGSLLQTLKRACEAFFGLCDGLVVPVGIGGNAIEVCALDDDMFHGIHVSDRLAFHEVGER
jgi:hypothetical protein